MLITDQDIKTMGTAMSMKYKFNSHHGIYITEFDKKRLKGLIKFAAERWDNKVLRYLEDLDAELDRAGWIRAVAERFSERTAAHL